ncbi:MAG: hypothetical protein FJ304_04215 [Planctomycetes bacterium]|nr:hypothetical protein [Planctomycetota bacterium]
MSQTLMLLVLGGVGVLLSASPAAAQFPRGYPAVPNIVPSYNPFFYLPQYRYQTSRSLSFSGPYGNFQYNSYRWGVSVNNPYAVAGAAALYNSHPLYAVGMSSMSGGTGMPTQLALAEQRAIERAQRAAALPGDDRTSPDRGPVGGIPLPGPGLELPKHIAAALATQDATVIGGGDPLNAILKEVQRFESKGAKGPSTFVPPLQLDDVRFAGPPVADLLNLARQGSKLNLPAVFDDAALAAVRKDLEKDFAAVAEALQAGKAPDAAKVAILAGTMKRVQTAAAPLVKDLPADGPTRTFLAELDRATTALRAGGGAGLIDPKWAAEGLTVGDLVKHMAKHKLTFAPAPLGRDDSYVTLHKNLATYLFVLSEAKK